MKNLLTKSYLLLVPLFLMAISCSSHKYTYSPDSKATTVQVKAGQAAPSNRVQLPRVGYLPNATAFRMSGDYADNVAITIDNNGVISYFPAPSDISADSKPVNLGNGWWLNNQGIGQNSVFTTYTFAEYASLPAAPSLEQLKNAIIPGAYVTQIIELPCSINDAAANINEIKTYLKDK